MKCWYCESELKDAPTDQWWIKKTYDEGICHRCILSLARSVLVTMERTAMGEYERGVTDGATKQAILELQGRDRFLKELEEKSP